MTQILDDSRHRPVVFETRAEQNPRRRMKPVRVLAGSTLVLAALTGAVGLALGGSAVWSAVQPEVPANAPAPLWISTPSHITKAATEDRDTIGADKAADKNKGQDDAVRSANAGNATSSTKGRSASSGHTSSSSGGGTSSGTGTASGNTATHTTPTTRGEPEPGDDGHQGGGGATSGGGGSSSSGGGSSKGGKSSGHA